MAVVAAEVVAALAVEVVAVAAVVVVVVVGRAALLRRVRLGSSVRIRRWGVAVQMMR